MKNYIKLSLEILITAACLFMIYELAIKSQDDNGNGITTQVVSLFAGAQETPDGQKLDLNAPEEMKALAKQKADEMIRTGDTSEYEAQLKQSGLNP